MSMDPQLFVAQWRVIKRNERQLAQTHFRELCAMLGIDSLMFESNGERAFLFEEAVTKATGGRGYADVFRRNHFGWEYKTEGEDLKNAYGQLLNYRGGLGNPPLLVVSDMHEFRIYPQWENISAPEWSFNNEDLIKPEVRDLLRWTLTDPQRLHHQLEREAEQRNNITKELAGDFAELYQKLLSNPYDSQGVHYTPQQVARFLSKIMFTMFVEDIGLLTEINGKPILQSILDDAMKPGNGATFARDIKELFRYFSGESESSLLDVPFFNGGLFEEHIDNVVIDLSTNADARGILQRVNAKHWHEVEPSVLGAMFERALTDVGNRKKLGAHFTSAKDMRLIIEPVLMQPLRRRWQEIQEHAEPLWKQYDQGTAREAHEATVRLRELAEDMLKTLKETTVLDPACGSGNFLYVSLQMMKDLEKEVKDYFLRLELPSHDIVTPTQFYGIEIEPFAAELARVSIWIGYLQWRYTHEGTLNWTRRGQKPQLGALPSPILPKESEHIINKDAVLELKDQKPDEPKWPSAEVIIGNPPYKGDKPMRSELGADYTKALRKVYKGRVPGGADFVMYWFEKARAMIEAGTVKRAGLLGTNSIRDGANRSVLERIKQTGDIFMAWSDLEWKPKEKDVAALNVSIVGFDNGSESSRILDDIPVTKINSSLTSTVDIKNEAQILEENDNLSFLGMMKSGPFDISEKLAQELLLANDNLNGRPNSDVVKRRHNGKALMGRRPNSWVIDFVNLPYEQAVQYTQPFGYIEEIVRPIRATNDVSGQRNKWWLFGRSRPALRLATKNQARFIVTPEVAKHRIFVWIGSDTVPDHTVHVIARDDDYMFGVLHSFPHELWSLRIGATLEDRPRYTSTRTFQTFPFPFTPGQEDFNDTRVQAISSVAATLHAERDAWLNPTGEEYKDFGGRALKERTLTNLYNAVARARGTIGKQVKLYDAARQIAPRLIELHDALDAAVLAAYNWSDLAGRLRTPDGDEELLSRLLAENLRRAAAQS